MGSRAHFNENLSMRAVAKHFASTSKRVLVYFCEQFEQRPNFASTSVQIEVRDFYRLKKLHVNPKIPFRAFHYLLVRSGYSSVHIMTTFARFFDGFEEDLTIVSNSIPEKIKVVKLTVMET